MKCPMIEGHTRSSKQGCQDMARRLAYETWCCPWFSRLHADCAAWPPTPHAVPASAAPGSRHMRHPLQHIFIHSMPDPAHILDQPVQVAHAAWPWSGWTGRLAWHRLRLALPGHVLHVAPTPAHTLDGSGVEPDAPWTGSRVLCGPGAAGLTPHVMPTPGHTLVLRCGASLWAQYSTWTDFESLVKGI